MDTDIKRMIDKGMNLYEIYLVAAANNEPVLKDLIYLKEIEDSDNYNKLLLTLSFEFLGDYQNAKDLYGSIKLSADEMNEYKSIVATIETFINRNNVVEKINEMIETDPADEYLRFAILSLFRNSGEDLEEEKVEVVCGDIHETITLNGMQVKTYYINNKDIEDISFKTDSDDLMVSYYYQTLLENIESDNIVQDMQIGIDGELKKYNTVTLKINFENIDACDMRISLPNSMRLAIPKLEIDSDNSYYLKNNNIDYIVVHKFKDYSQIEIPLQIVYEGEYKFEGIVVEDEDVYHISNSIDLTINK